MKEVGLGETAQYFDILEAKDKEALENFKYNGKDDSILYEHVMSPMCQWIVENWVPTRFTPNMITLVGLQFVLIPHLLIISTAWYDTELPHWSLYFINAIGTLVYSVRHHDSDLRQPGRKASQIHQSGESAGNGFRPRVRLLQ